MQHRQRKSMGKGWGLVQHTQAMGRCLAAHVRTGMGAGSAATGTHTAPPGGTCLMTSHIRRLECGVVGTGCSPYVLYDCR